MWCRFKFGSSPVEVWFTFGYGFARICIDVRFRLVLVQVCLRFALGAGLVRFGFICWFGFGSGLVQVRFRFGPGVVKLWFRSGSNLVGV